MELVELRWFDHGNRTMLQYRTRQPVADASGAICGFTEWGEWRNVPTQDCH